MFKTVFALTIQSPKKFEVIFIPVTQNLEDNYPF